VDTIDEIDDGTFFVRGSMGIKFVGVDRLHRQFMIEVSSHGRMSVPVVCERSERQNSLRASAILDIRGRCSLRAYRAFLSLAHFERRYFCIPVRCLLIFNH
jgi:hypothetical protein